MQPFHFARTNDLNAAVLMHGARSENTSAVSADAPVQYLAGGTTLLDLMKLEVMRPEQVIDINALERTGTGTIYITGKQLRLGAMSRMSAVADHAEIKRDFPIISQSLTLAASSQPRPHLPHGADTGPALPAATSRTH